eukprot:2481975-Rhodomonas_salina.3
MMHCCRWYWQALGASLSDHCSRRAHRRVSLRLACQWAPGPGEPAGPSDIDSEPARGPGQWPQWQYVAVVARR